METKFKYASIVLIILIIILIAFAKFYNKDIETAETLNLSENTEITENEIDNVVISEPVKQYVDNNPIKLGIYMTNDSNTKRLLLTEDSNKWVYHKDIDVYNIIYTQKPEIEAINTGECFAKYLAEYEEDVSEYRVGFHVKFETEDGEVDKTILSPKDVDEFFDYLEIYLYDGYHRKKGEWYSHTTEEQFNEDTIFTAIKFTAGKKINKITSDIELTAFSYIKDDLDEDNNYIGNSKYSIVVKKK